MSSSYISPGVYVEENDLSQYVSDLATTIVAMVGTADKGPSNTPVTITSAKNFIDVFGQPNPNHYLGYAALAYLKQGNKLYINRVSPADSAKSHLTLPVPASYTPYSGEWNLTANTATTATFELSNPTGSTGANQLVAIQTASTKLPGFNFSDSTATTGGAHGNLAINTLLGSDLKSFVTQQTAGHGTVDSYVKGRQFKITAGPGKDSSVVITNLSANADPAKLTMTVDSRKFGSFNSPATSTTATGSLSFVGGTGSWTSVTDTQLAIIGKTGLGATEANITLNYTSADYVDNDAKAILVTTLTSGASSDKLIALNKLVYAEATSGSTEVRIGVPLFFDTAATGIIGDASAIKNATLVSLILSNLVEAARGNLGPISGVTYADLNRAVGAGDGINMGFAGAKAAGIVGIGSVDTLTSATAGFKSAEVVATDTKSVKLSAISVGASGRFTIVVNAAVAAILTSSPLQITGSFELDLCRPTWVVSLAGTSTYVPTLLKFSTLGEGDFSNLAITVLIDETDLTSTQEQQYTVALYGRVVSDTVSSTSNLQSDFVLLESYAGTPSVLQSKINNTSTTISLKLDYSTLDEINYTTGTTVVGAENDYLTASFALSPAADGISMLVGAKTSVSGSIYTPAFATLMAGGSAGTLVSKYDVLGDPALKTGIYGFSDPEQFDVNLILAPGWSADPAVAKGMVAMCESRGDCMAILDTPFGLSVENVIKYKRNVLNITSNYAALYYPWVKIADSVNKKDIFVPPSGLVAGQYAFNDKVGEVFTAPAGRTRGVLTEALATERILNLGDRDLLTMAQVNPIHYEAGQGIFIRGQMTCQSATTALDRVNVRRLLLNLRKVIATASKKYEFEPGDAITALRLKQLAESTLEDRLRKGAIRSYKVDVGPNVNTALSLENNELHMLIEIVPTKTAEKIIEVFNILGQGKGISVSV